MGDLPFLEEWTGESTDELLSMKGQFRTDSLVLAFEQAILAKTDAKLSNLTEEERAIVTVEALERQVNNGGYHQFFVNEPFIARHIVDSLKKIGCPKTAQITQEAIDAIGLSEDISAKAVETAIHQEHEERDNSLHQLSGLFLKYEEPIEERLFEFILNNRTKIHLESAKRGRSAHQAFHGGNP